MHPVNFSWLLLLGTGGENTSEVMVWFSSLLVFVVTNHDVLIRLEVQVVLEVW